VFDCALGAAARTIPDPRWRAEVVDVARRSAADQGRLGRGREVMATAVFGLRLRSLRATGGRSGEAWRQGARLGAGLLLATAWVGSVAALADARPDVAAVVTVLALGAGWASSLVGRPPVVVPTTAVALTASWAGTGWSPVSTALAVALGAMVVAGGAAAVPGGRWSRSLAGVGLGVLGLAALTGPGTVVATTTAVTATLVVPVVLVTLGGADARYAAAAVVAWAWRFLALDPGDVLDAGSALARGEGIRIALVRLVVMAWAVALAVAIALRTERRAAL